MRPLPRLISKIPVHRLLQLIPALLEIQLCDTVFCTLAANHPAADFGFPRFLFLALNGSRAERNTRWVVCTWDEDCAARGEEVVCGEVVVGAEDGSGNVVPEGEGGDCVVGWMEEVEGVFWWG